MKLNILASAGAIAVPAWSGVASAAPVSVRAVMSPTDEIRMDFKDGSKHFVLMVRREGMAAAFLRAHPWWRWAGTISNRLLTLIRGDIWR
jgi:hypothetical protein